jgi:hypothetical protein
VAVVETSKCLKTILNISHLRTRRKGLPVAIVDIILRRPDGTENMNVLVGSATYEFDILELGHGLWGTNRCGDIREYKKSGDPDRDGWYRFIP